MYKHLFFDLDNTIWDFDLNSFHAMQKVYHKYGLPDPDYARFFEVYTRINDSLWELYRKNRIQKQELAAERFNLTFSETGISGIDGQEFNKLYLEEMPFQTRLCDGAHEVLEQLSQKYQLHIITNGFIEVQYKKLENSNLRQFFNRIFISEEIKAPKPSREIFMHALKSSNARKRESLMIGDSWDVDIIGAMDFGIDQVHYAPNLPTSGFSYDETEIISQSSIKTYRIKDLKGLINILKVI